MTKNLSKALINQRKKSEPFRKTLYGSLGIPLNGQKLVQVPNRQSYVYVRLNDNQNEVIQAFNNTVAPSYDLPVIVVRDGGRYTVKQVNTQRYENNWNNSAPYLPLHGTSHSFFPGGGGDISWIYSRQIMHGLVYPTVTGSTLDIASFPLYTPNGWVLAGATGTVNLLQYRPVSGSAALMMLLYADSSNGNPGLLVNSGSYIDYAITGSVYAHIPRPNLATQIPLAAIRISTGTLQIGWDNLYDVRQWIHSIPSGTSSSVAGSSSGFAGLYNGIPLGTGTSLNVQGNAIFTISGSRFDLNILQPSTLDNFWNSGSAGSYSIRAKNDTSINAVSNYATAIGQGTYASGTASFAGGNGNQAISNNSVALGGQSNRVSGLNSVILGGQNNSGTHDNTVFVPQLNISTLSSGTAVTNLGINSAGMVVSGSVTPSYPGSWTPTLSSGTNTQTLVSSLCYYVRTGNLVTFAGSVQVDTGAVGAFTFYMSLPIASNFDATTDANGNGTQPGAGVPNIISIREDQTNDRLQFDGYAQVNTNLFYRFVGMYVIK